MKIADRRSWIEVDIAADTQRIVDTKRLAKVGARHGAAVVPVRRVHVVGLSPGWRTYCTPRKCVVLATYFNLSI